MIAAFVGSMAVAEATAFFRTDGAAFSFNPPGQMVFEGLVLFVLPCALAALLVRFPSGLGKRAQAVFLASSVTFGGVSALLFFSFGEAGFNAATVIFALGAVGYIGALALTMRAGELR